MTNAYNSTYLPDAMATLGEAFDYAEWDTSLGAQGFLDLFVATGVADGFGAGSPAYVAGMSGVELVREVARQGGRFEKALPSAAERPGRSEAYWVGWILAFYQWSSGKPFRAICKLITVEELEGLYHPLHEASDERAAQVLGEIIARKRPMTRLQELRRQRGLSQSELASRSGVSLRAIQQYEQRRKSIDRAQAIAVSNLARVLGVRAEDLLEYEG